MQPKRQYLLDIVDTGVNTSIDLTPFNALVCQKTALFYLSSHDEQIDFPITMIIMPFYDICQSAFLRKH